MTTNQLLKNLIKTIKDTQPKTKAYDTTAEIKRIEGNTAWVQIPGGAPETPVSLSIDGKPGDTVRIRVSGGRAWLTGNDTAPPTDDTKAIEAKREATNANQSAIVAIETAENADAKAEKTASHFWVNPDGAHITENTAEEFIADPSGSNLLLQTDGISLRDGLVTLSKFAKNRMTLQTGNSLPYLDVDAESGSARDFRVAQNVFSTETIDGGTSIEHRQVTVKISDNAQDVTANLFHIFTFSEAIDSFHTENGYAQSVTNNSIEYFDLDVGDSGTLYVGLEGGGTFSVTIEVDEANGGVFNESITMSSTNVGAYDFDVSGEVEYTTYATAPRYTLGTRSPSFSKGTMTYCLGEGLAAPYDSQSVFGRFNAISDSPFIFGYGTADDPQTRRNLLEIDAEGYVKPEKGLVLKDTDGIPYHITVTPEGVLDGVIVQGQRGPKGDPGTGTDYVCQNILLETVSMEEWNQGGVNVSTGTPNTNSNACRTDRFYISKDTTITINPGGMYYNYGLYDSEGSFTPRGNSWVTDGVEKTYTIDRDCECIVWVKQSDSSDFTPEDVTATVSYADSKLYDAQQDIIDLQDRVAHNIISLDPEVDFEDGGCNSSGSILSDLTTNAQRARSKVPYSDIKTVTISAKTQTTVYIKKYDEAGKAIGVITAVTTTYGTTRDVSDAKYIRVSAAVTNGISELTDKAFSVRLSQSLSEYQLNTLNNKLDLDKLAPIPGSYQLGPLNQIARLGWHPYDSGFPPQQSLPSYLLAYQNRCRMMLADVRKTADGVFVCWHDEALTSNHIRHTDGSALTTQEKAQKISDLTLAELDAYDFGIAKGSAYAGMKILRLKDFLDFCAKLGVWACLEVKDRFTESSEINALRDLVYLSKMTGNTIYMVYYTHCKDILEDNQSEAQYTWLAACKIGGKVSQFLVLSAQAAWSTAVSIAANFRAADIPVYLGHLHPEDITTEMRMEGYPLFYGEIQSTSDMDDFYNAGYLEYYDLINSGYVDVVGYVYDKVSS